MCIFKRFIIYKYDIYNKIVSKYIIIPVYIDIIIRNFF